MIARTEWHDWGHCGMDGCWSGSFGWALTCPWGKCWCGRFRGAASERLGKSPAAPCVREETAIASWTGRCFQASFTGNSRMVRKRSLGISFRGHFCNAGVCYENGLEIYTAYVDRIVLLKILDAWHHLFSSSAFFPYTALLSGWFHQGRITKVQNGNVAYCIES